VEDVLSWRVKIDDLDAPVALFGLVVPLPLAAQPGEHFAITFDSGWDRFQLLDHLPDRICRHPRIELGERGLEKETEIGPLPLSWEPRPILELCEIWSGGTPRKSVVEYWNGDIPWVSGKDLKTPYLDDAIDHITNTGVENGSRLAPKNAVLLLVRGMGLVKDLPVAVINRSMAFNQDIKALVSRGEFSGQFLRSAIYVRKDRLLAKIVPSAHGTMTLNLNDIETFKLPCPTDPKEAEEVVAILASVDRKIDLHRRKRAVLDDLFKSLLRKLMTGEIRVIDFDLLALSPKPVAGVAA
jgi:type I restriction enzyme, S subunit